MCVIDHNYIPKYTYKYFVSNVHSLAENAYLSQMLAYVSTN